MHSVRLGAVPSRNQQVNGDELSLKNRKSFPWFLLTLHAPEGMRQEPNQNPIRCSSVRRYCYCGYLVSYPLCRFFDSLFLRFATVMPTQDIQYGIGSKRFAE